MDAFAVAIIDTVVMIARIKSPERAEVRLDERLREDIGFDSLDLAHLVAELEIRVGVDPFARHTVVRVRTVEDLLNAYRQASAEAREPRP
jgi:acyl carrier protein